MILIRADEKRIKWNDQVAQSDTIEEAEIQEDSLARLGSMGNMAASLARG
jgi:hypothetical protein